MLHTRSPLPSEVLTAAEWINIFKPTVNPKSHEGDADIFNLDVPVPLLFEHDREHDKALLEGVDYRHVWTVVSGDNSVYIVEGRHYVNRICHLITDVAWDTDYHYEIDVFSGSEVSLTSDCNLKMLCNRCLSNDKRSRLIARFHEGLFSHYNCIECDAKCKG